MCDKRFFGFFFVLVLTFGSCTLSPGRDWIDVSPSPDMGGGSRSFKVPIPPGYNWEITQSWLSHCSECQQKYSDWNYCELSHSWNCCKYGWDFNLPGNEDKGKPILATSDGVVKEMGLDYGWGNYIVIDHGNNICSRYAHMLDGSTDHLSDGQTVCQGLKIGEIGTTGDSSGYHLHFQFEECDNSSVSIERRFTDGNNIPKCTRGNDIFDSQGNYTALILTNTMVYSCDQSGETFGGGELSEGGWYSAECGNLPGCPLIPNCGREWGHEFTDQGSFSSQVAEAGAYLYSECALDGKADGGLHPSDKLTRAEALKVPMFLYGLMNNCGASDPFADVDQSDWYFGVIACAVLHGIVNSVVNYFRPNDEVEFAEAAKFVVEAASRAGVIDIQNPSQGHFPNIPRSHWAYKYVETIYHYGGLDSSALNFSADREIDRGDYFIMVASLSPCYCRNVNCESGCQCDQSVFACVDPNDMTPGAGGGGDDDPEDPEEFYPDISIDCYVDTEDTECVDPDAVLQIDCDVTNNGNENVNVNDLGLAMTDSSAGAVCQVTDDDYINGVGYQVVEPGETKSLHGHFYVACLERPADGDIDVSLDLNHVVTGPDPNIFFPDVAQTTIFIPAAPFAQCEAEFSVPDCIADCTGIACGHDGCGGICNSCPYGQSCNLTISQCQGDYQVPWGNCDPAVGYTVIMDSPGGSIEIATSGPTSYYSTTFPPGMALNVHFDCIDLPGSILIHGGPQYVQAYLEDSGQPDFYFWSGYSGPLVIDPSIGAGGHTSSFTATFPNLSFLLRTPNP